MKTINITEKEFEKLSFEVLEGSRDDFPFVTSDQEFFAAYVCGCISKELFSMGDEENA